MSKTFQNWNLIKKVIRCLNCSLQLKTTVIYESKDLSSMDLTTLFGKYHEDEFELRKRNDLHK